MHNVFKDKMNDTSFLKWLASKLNRPCRFFNYVANWKDKNFTETRGKSELPLEVRQAIYDTWVENSISSTDCRNGRNVINIRKRKYFSLYRDIEKNIRGHAQFQANRMILTCTVLNIQNKFTESGVKVSLGKVMSFNHFSLHIPQKKKSLYVCVSLF